MPFVDEAPALDLGPVAVPAARGSETAPAKSVNVVLNVHRNRKAYLGTGRSGGRRGYGRVGEEVEKTTTPQ